MLVDLLKVTAIGRYEDLQLRGPAGRMVAAVVDLHAIQRHHPAKIDLPPGVVFQRRMESPLAILDAIDCADGVRLGRYFALQAAHLVLAEPIGLDLSPRGRRCHGVCLNCPTHH